MSAGVQRQVEDVAVEGYPMLLVLPTMMFAQVVLG
jgi:hypothetical protein